jgi:hypothetical protein
MTKRILFFVVTNLVFGLYAYAQVVQGQAIERIEVQLPVHPSYDSLTNKVSYDNCRRYIGQKIYMLSYSNLYEGKDRNVEGSNFFLSPNTSHNKKNVYTPIRSGTSSNYNFSMYGGGPPAVYHTDYSAIAGKYLKVIDVIDQSNTTGNNGVFFVLQNQENNEILYYDITHGENTNNIRRGPWVCVGYYEKIKTFYKGKKFIKQGNLKAMYAVNSGKSVLFSEGEELICKDVTLLDSKYNKLTNLCLILKDTLGNEVAESPQEGLLMANEQFVLPTTAGFKLESQVVAEQKAEQEREARQALQEQYKAEQAALEAKMAIEAEQAHVNGLIKKYGKKFGAKIASGQVELGMTKDMCNQAWGEPRNIRQTATATGTNEKWFYGDDSYLRFKGNSLIEIQN